ncbi:MAG: hypothetical protein KDC27_11290 [Acidobacteria bacterium]|nr:hypothetical protein [Acidobacteriota bacterium]
MATALQFKRTRTVRVGYAGLSPEDRGSMAALMRALAEESDSFEAVENGYHACFVDLQTPNSIALLRSLPRECVVIFAVGPEGPNPPSGYLSVPKPFHLQEIRRTLEQLEARLRGAEQTAAAVRSSSLAATSQQSARPCSDLEDIVLVESGAEDEAVLKFSSLADLSVHLRGNRHSALVCVENFHFVIEVEKGLHYATVKPDALARYRGVKNLSIRLIPSTSVRVGLNLLPRRIEAFLWELGMNAGDGRLLPGIDPQAAFKVNRWPPLTGTKDRSQFFQVSATISRVAAPATAISRMTNVPIAKVNDYLNACWMVGCLECSERVERKSPPPAPAPPLPKAATRSLLSRIRNRLGI